MKAILELVSVQRFYFVRNFGIVILVFALLAGCTAGTDTGPATESEHLVQNMEETHPFQLEPLVFTSDAEEAFYSFDWKDMSLAEDVFFEVVRNCYTVRFADLDLDGKPEVLLSSEGDYLYSIIPTMIFTVKGNKLEPVATVKLAQDDFGNDVYGPDSWREGWKQIYQDANGKRVILEYISKQVEGHTYGYYLYEVSLDDYSVTPVMIYREPDSHYASFGAVSSWYYYDRETGFCTSENFRENAWDDNELIEQGIIPISEAEYEQHMEEYLASLTPAGTLPVSEELSYSVSLGYYEDYEQYGLDIILPDGVDEEQKNELINRGLAKKIYEQYQLFQTKIQGQITPRFEQPWLPQEYTDKLEAALCNFPWLGTNQKPHLQIYGQYTTAFEVVFGDIDLDGEAELLLYMDTTYKDRVIPTYGGCEVFSLKDDTLVYRGGFLLSDYYGEDKFIREYYKDPQGSPTVPMEFLSVPTGTDIQPDKYGENPLEILYQTDLKLTDLQFTVLAARIGTYTQYDIGPYASTSPTANGIIPKLRATDTFDTYQRFSEYGFTSITDDEYAQIEQRFGYTGPFEIEMSDVVLRYSAFQPGHFYQNRTRDIGSHWNRVDFLPKASNEEFEEYLNDRIGRQIYDAWISYQKE